MFNFEIEFLNKYGHIIKSFYIENCTEKQAIRKAKKEKTDLYPDCAWSEILNLNTRKKIYA